MNKLVRFALDRKYRFGILVNLGLTNWIPDKEFIKINYRIRMGRKLNLDHPTTFNEKLQWLKLYDRRPEYTKMVDKYEAKKYVASVIGDEYIIPTYGVWDSFDDIDFDSLPEQFVLKCTHDSGGLVICRNRNEFDYENAKRKINKSLKTNFFYHSREWPYKNVKPRIIAEKYMEEEDSKELRDYKFFCFSGVVKALFIATDRFTPGVETKFDFFDCDFRHLPLTNGHPNADYIPFKPSKFDEMKNIAQKLSQDIPHLRVDFYEVNNKIYFGELTFSHWSGMVPFVPEKWDKIFGDWISLPENVGGGYGLITDNYVLWLHQKQNKGLVDYKFFCFNGQPKLLYISRGLEHHPTAEISFYGLDGKEKEYHRADYKPFHNALLPRNYEKMLNIAQELSETIGNAFVRIDLYSIEDKVFFSEITFSPCSGMIPFDSDIADYELGSFLNIC